MGRGSLAGTRIRERRLLLGLRQADLARAAGVSAAYLNLIEHNRRRVGPELLVALARGLGVEPAALEEGAERAVVLALREAALVAHVPPELDRIEDFLGRYPGWAALLAARQMRVAALERTVVTLTERLSQDPYLAETLHEVLSAVTSLRSAAAILAETEDIEPEWRARFQRTIHEESLRLSEAAGALASYLEAAASEEAALSAPQEEMEAWLAARDYALEDVPGDPVAGAAELVTSAARALARAHVARARADAAALPRGRFVARLAALGPMPDQLAAEFGVPLAQVMRRIATLPPGRGPAAGLVECDGSGALTFRRPVAGFDLPRFGAACPLWPLYQALRRPGQPIRALVEVSGRVTRRFRVYAVADLAYPGGFDGPELVSGAMLILPEVGSATGAGAVPVGASCRICPRAACPARREPSILGAAI